MKTRTEKYIEQDRADGIEISDEQYEQAAAERADYADYKRDEQRDMEAEALEGREG